MWFSQGFMLITHDVNGKLELAALFLILVVWLQESHIYLIFHSIDVGVVRCFHSLFVILGVWWHLFVSLCIFHIMLFSFIWNILILEPDFYLHKIKLKRETKSIFILFSSCIEIVSISSIHNISGVQLNTWRRFSHAPTGLGSI